MICTQVEEEFPYTPDVVRTPGVHLMEVVKSMARDLFNTGSKPYGGSNLLQFEKGYVWERELSRAFGDGVAERIGEIECDGIICSPDGLRVGSDGEIIVEEYKCTSMSSRKSPADIWTWHMQAKGYAYVTGADEAIFRVFYINGDYREMSPEYKVWRLEFSRNELIDVWVSIVNHAKNKGMIG